MNLKRVYPKRPLWTHKGEHGYVLILAGSKRYSGSPVFNAVSALRAGADLTCCVGPERAMNIAAAFLPDMICHPLAGDILRPQHVPFILNLAQKPSTTPHLLPKGAGGAGLVPHRPAESGTGAGFDSIILGCGLGRAPETVKAIQEIITGIDKPMVIDADGIRAISQKREIIKGKTAVLTPNILEFEILTGETVRANVEDRKDKVKKWAKILGCTILLKGHIDVISDGRQVALNKTGSPYMTKGGLGDSLSGILGAILARKISPLEAAKAASFINGKAGEQASKKYGEGLMASDIFEFIPQVIKRYRS